MVTKVKPIGNRVVARQLPPPEKSQGGIWLLTDKEAKSIRFAVKRFEIIEPEQGIQDPKTGGWHRTTKLEPGDIIRTGMYPGASAPDPDRDGEWIWFIHYTSIICQEVA